jgi:hypothetical protein
LLALRGDLVESNITYKRRRIITNYFTCNHRESIGADIRKYFFDSFVHRRSLNFRNGEIARYLGNKAALYYNLASELLAQSEHTVSGVRFSGVSRSWSREFDFEPSHQPRFSLSKRNRNLWQDRYASV